MSNSRKGHQGFIKKYQMLGETKHIRIPISVCSKIKHMTLLLESIAFEKGIDKVNLILDKIIEGLENVWHLKNWHTIPHKNLRTCYSLSCYKNTSWHFLIQPSKIFLLLWHLMLLMTSFRMKGILNWWWNWFLNLLQRIFSQKIMILLPRLLFLSWITLLWNHAGQSDNWHRRNSEDLRVPLYWTSQPTTPDMDFDTFDTDFWSEIQDAPGEIFDIDEMMEEEQTWNEFVNSNVTVW